MLTNTTHLSLTKVFSGSAVVNSHLITLYKRSNHGHVFFFSHNLMFDIIYFFKELKKKFY